jgi:hypothetical protein
MINAVIRKIDWRTCEAILVGADDKVVGSERVTRDTGGRWIAESHPNLIFATRREAVSFLCAQREAGHEG